MKILWFANTAANAAGLLQSSAVGGGWLQSLDALLQQKVELHIAFYWPKQIQPFQHGETVYHPIIVRNWKLRALKASFVSDVLYDQDLPLYLDIIGRVEPDVIHIHGTENPFGCIIKHTSIPVIVSIQGIINAIYSKFAAGFTINELKFKPASLKQGWKNWILSQSFYRVRSRFDKMRKRELDTLSVVKIVLGRTDWDRRVSSVLAKQAAYYHCDELLRPVFYRTEWRSRDNRKLIIHTTTSDSPYKGFETICEAIIELNRFDDLEFEWRIAGISSGSQIVGITRRKLGANFPNKGLNFLGSVTEERLVEAMVESNIFVMASHIDNSPNSLCEAMLIGMPCIATHAGGTSSMLRDGEEGLLVQDGDPLALAGAVLELYRNKEKSQSMAMKARSRAMIRHDRNRILGSILNIYETAIGSNK